MGHLLNLVSGFVITGITVLAVVFVFNKFSKSGGVAKLGTGPLLKSV